MVKQPFTIAEDGSLMHCGRPAYWEQCEEHTKDGYDCGSVVCSKCQFSSCDEDWETNNNPEEGN